MSLGYAKNNNWCTTEGRREDNTVLVADTVMCKRSCLLRCIPILCYLLFLFFAPFPFPHRKVFNKKGPMTSIFCLSVSKITLWKCQNVALVGNIIKNPIEFEKRSDLTWGCREKDFRSHPRPTHCCLHLHSHPSSFRSCDPERSRSSVSSQFTHTFPNTPGGESRNTHAHSHRKQVTLLARRNQRCLLGPLLIKNSRNHVLHAPLALFIYKLPTHLEHKCVWLKSHAKKLCQGCMIKGKVS